MPRVPRKFFKSGLVVIVCLAVVAVLWWRWDQITDWVRLLGYTPPPAVAELAEQDTMNSYTRHLFYLNKPQLLGTVASFRQNCPEDEQTIVLGCYHPDQDGIYIYAVSNPALYGVQQVTAAHEVLHAVYARLSSSQRANLDQQLMNFYKNDLHNKRVLAEVKIYQRTEPGDVYDEMSCTFGTEIAKLPAGLEHYYAQFFTNRLAIVAFEQRYNQAFTSRQDKVNAYDRQLNSLKTQISNEEAKLTAELASMNKQQSRLDSLKSSGQIAAYNAAVPGYNSAVNSYNAGVNSLQSEITNYNLLVASRNGVAEQLGSLDKSIDTRLTTEPTR